MHKCLDEYDPPPTFYGGILFSAKVLIYNLSSSCPIFSNFHHTSTIRNCMFCRKIGAEGSVSQELCSFVVLTVRCLS